MNEQQTPRVDPFYLQPRRFSASCPARTPDEVCSTFPMRQPSALHGRKALVPVSSGCPDLPPLSASCRRIELSSSCPADLLSSSCPADAPSSSCSAAETLGAARSADLLSPARVEYDPGGSKATLRHAFCDEETAFFLELPDCHAVVSHCATRHGAPGVEVETLAIEHAPAFVHASNPIQELGSHDILGILKGEVRSWAVLGGHSQPLRLYLHGGALQRRKFLVLAGSLGISAEDLARAQPEYLPSYDTLEQAAVADPQAIVLGLKTSASLRLLRIDGELPCVPGRGYALTLPIDFLHRGTAAAHRFEAVLRERLGAGRAAFQARHQAAAA